MVRKDRSSFSVVHEPAGTAISQVMSAKPDDEVAVNGSNAHRLATGADDFRVNLTNEPIRLRVRSAKVEAASSPVLRYARCLGAGHHPHGSAGARGERQAVTKAFILARRHAGAGGPTLDRAAVIKPSPNQTLLPLGGRGGHPPCRLQQPRGCRGGVDADHAVDGAGQPGHYRGSFLSWAWSGRPGGHRAALL
jgi:hypothetical protein